MQGDAHNRRSFRHAHITDGFLGFALLGAEWVMWLSLAADDPDSLTLYIVAHDNRGSTDSRALSLQRAR